MELVSSRVICWERAAVQSGAFRSATCLCIWGEGHAFLKFDNWLSPAVVSPHRRPCSSSECSQLLQVTWLTCLPRILFRRDWSSYQKRRHFKVHSSQDVNGLIESYTHFIQAIAFVGLAPFSQLAPCSVAINWHPFAKSLYWRGHTQCHLCSMPGLTMRAFSSKQCLKSRFELGWSLSVDVG